MLVNVQELIQVEDHLAQIAQCRHRRLFIFARGVAFRLRLQKFQCPSHLFLRRLAVQRQLECGTDLFARVVTRFSRDSFGK